MLRPDEDVQVLGLAVHADVKPESEAAADEVRNAGTIEHLHRPLVEDVVELALSHGAYQRKVHATHSGAVRILRAQLDRMSVAAQHMVRIAAVGDVHCTRNTQTTLRPFFA